MSHLVHPGTIERIFRNQIQAPYHLQVISLKPFGNSSDNATRQRYRVHLNDGSHSFASCMLATQLNHLVDAGSLADGSVVKINQAQVNTIAAKKSVIIIVTAEVVATKVPQIGNPTPFNAEGVTENNPPNVQQPLVQRPVAPPAPAAAPYRPAAAPSYMTAHQPKPAAPAATPAFRPSAPVATGSAMDGRICPIAALTPYQTKWQIKARCTQKAAVKTWSNARGEGKLFSCTLTDDSGDIRLTLFKNEVDKWFDYITVGSVYMITRCQLKPANKQWSSCSHDYEMSAHGDSEFQLCPDGDSSVPSVMFNFTPLSTLDQVEPNRMIDVIGVVHSVDPVVEIMTKKGEPLNKRDILIVDQGETCVRLTIWGQEAQNWYEDPSNAHPVVAIKHVRVGDFNGRSLSLVFDSVTMINPSEVPEAVTLRTWYDTRAAPESFTKYEGGSSGGAAQVWMYMRNAMPDSDKGTYFNDVLMITKIDYDKVIYKACSSADCQKKVLELGNNMYRCEKCNKDDCTFRYRFMIQAECCDLLTRQYVTIFHDQAEQIFGVTAQQIGEMREANDESCTAFFQRKLFLKWQCRLRAKMDNFNDENRLKFVLFQATPMDRPKYHRALLEDCAAVLASLK